MEDPPEPLLPQDVAEGPRRELRLSGGAACYPFGGEVRFREALQY